MTGELTGPLLCKNVVSVFFYLWNNTAPGFTQDELKLPKHRSITESPTRWGSHYAMIAGVLEQEKAIAKVLSDDKKKHRHLIPSAGYGCLGVCPQGNKSTFGFH